MTHFIDNGGRWHWYAKDFEDVSVGDEFIIEHVGRFGSNHSYSNPLKVTRISDLNVWLEPHKEGGKETRVARTSGKVFGGYYDWARPATDRLKAKIRKERKAKKAKDNAAKKKADDHEQKLREHYGADKIEDADIQKILKPIRGLAENGRQELKTFFEDTESDNNELIEERARRVLHYLDWNGEKKLRQAEYFYKTARQLHDRLVGMVVRWNRGYAFQNKKVGKKAKGFNPKYPTENGGLKGLLKAEIKNTIDSLTDYYFHDSDPEDYRRAFIDRLREIAEIRYVYGQISQIEKEKDNA